MGVGHVPQDPLRPQGEGVDVQGRQRRGTAGGRSVDLARQARGRWGEAEAERWYRRAGYEVLARNWRCAAGEIDLIAASGREVVFVEVKARADDRFGPAAGAVDERKQRRLRHLAALWLMARVGDPVDVRFDVVAITGTRVEVFERAF